MLIPKVNRNEVYKALFSEGVIWAKKDYNLPKHPEVGQSGENPIDVPNLQVIKLMQSFKSKGFVNEIFSWRHYYWYLTDEGIEYLREYLNLSADVVPNTLKKAARAPTREVEAPRGGRGGRGGFGGDRGGRGGFGGDRQGYRQ
jgi:small subunit ribosomal protein S10e